MIFSNANRLNLVESVYLTCFLEWLGFINVFSYKLDEATPPIP
jgi:hypothetical protein